MDTEGTREMITFDAAFDDFLDFWKRAFRKPRKLRCRAMRERVAEVLLYAAQMYPSAITPDQIKHEARLRAEIESMAKSHGGSVPPPDVQDILAAGCNPGLFDPVALAYLTARYDHAVNDEIFFARYMWIAFGYDVITETVTRPRWRVSGSRRTIVIDGAAQIKWTYALMMYQRSKVEANDLEMLLDEIDFSRLSIEEALSIFVNLVPDAYNMASVKFDVETANALMGDEAGLAVLCGYAYSRIAKNAGPALKRVLQRERGGLDLGLCRNLPARILSILEGSMTDPPKDALPAAISSTPARSIAALPGRLMYAMFVENETVAEQHCRKEKRQGNDVKPVDSAGVMDPVRDDSERRLLNREYLAALEKAANLREEDRTALWLAFREGLTESEIAQRMGWPIYKVRNRRRRALDALRKAAAKLN